MLRRVRFLLVSFIFGLLAFFGASPAGAQTLPLSLQGETFSNVRAASFESVEHTSNCRYGMNVGEILTVTYRVRGVAAGPYPGFFTETGTITGTVVATTPAGGSGATITEWNATFTIDSTFDVTGEKRLSPSFLGLAGVACTPTISNPPIVNFVNASAVLDYHARIQTDTGTFTDDGLASAHINDGEFAISDHEWESFGEIFFLSTGVLPLDTSGKATGGGQILSGSNPFAGVTFGFNVRKDENDRLHGECNVLDHATQTHVNCLTVSDYEQVGTTATWEGTAEVNGVEEHYRITVQDNGAPNQGIDTFSIVTDSYEAAGNVQHGNVQLHNQELTPLGSG